MDYLYIILNNYYLYFLSFNNIKNYTTFRCLSSLFLINYITVYYYLLINLIIYLIKNNLSKFNKNSINLNFFFNYFHNYIF